MKRILTSFIAAAFAVLLFTASVAAQRTLPLVVDDAGLLSTLEKDELTAELEAIAELYEFEIAIVTKSSISGSIQAYADDFYDDNGYGFGDNDDGALLLIDMDEREWWITTHGCGEDILDYDVLGAIENEFIKYLSNGSYYDAFSIFADKCADYLEAAQNVTYPTDDLDFVFDYGYDYDYDYGYDYDEYDYDSSEDSRSPLTYLLPALIVGFVIALIMVSVMKSGMKTVKSALNAASYVVNGSLMLNSQSDNYLYSNVVRTPRSSSTSRSGGHRSSGGSHRSSSGRSHGGRGGRF